MMAILAAYEAPRSSGETDGEATPFIDDEEKSGGCDVRRQGKKVSWAWLSIGVPWMLVVLCLGYIVFYEGRQPSELACTRLLNPYSPLIEAGVVQYYEADLDNAFAHQTVYRGVPTVELENAWARLWKRGATEVPAASIHKLNRTSTKLVHVNNDPERGYVGLLEVSHRLHCLNLVRQYTYASHYAAHPLLVANITSTSGLDLDVSDPHNAADRMHVDHCLETLRLGLMCEADVTPSLLMRNTHTASGHEADFNTFHKCRDFERIMEWQEGHTCGESGEA